MFAMKEVGKRITEGRRAKGMTQMALADALGISYQAVSSWENGRTMPDISKLPEISEILGISVDEILGKEAPAVQAALTNDTETVLTPEDIAEMESLYNLMEYHILHGQDYLDEDMKFHRTIARASGNLVAPQLAPIITASVEVFTEGTHRTLLQETLDTHKAVLEAIKCGDSTWARDAMTLHLSYNRDLYRKMHRARSGEPPLAPKVPEWVLQLKELTKPEEPEEKE